MQRHTAAVPGDPSATPAAECGRRWQQREHPVFKLLVGFSKPQVWIQLPSGLLCRDAHVASPSGVHRPSVTSLPFTSAFIQQSHRVQDHLSTSGSKTLVFPTLAPMVVTFFLRARERFLSTGTSGSRETAVPTASLAASLLGTDASRLSQPEKLPDAVVLRSKPWLPHGKCAG